MVLQLGYQRGLRQHFDLDVLLEADFYRKNDEYGPDKLTRRQHPWYEAKGRATYLFNNRGGSQLGVGTKVARPRSKASCRATRSSSAASMFRAAPC